MLSAFLDVKTLVTLQIITSLKGLNAVPKFTSIINGINNETVVSFNRLIR